MDGRTDGRTDRKDGGIRVLTYGRTDGGTEGRTDSLMEGQTGIRVGR